MGLPRWSAQSSQSRPDAGLQHSRLPGANPVTALASFLAQIAALRQPISGSSRKWGQSPPLQEGTD
ncbi:hypothetical protein D554_0752 [Bordetella holmesii 30539]|uniref:Uncharacterized protein n=2 Tax=Bordetella holmesii TaxID=35814 RepID=A0A158M0P9_9BORD|nr:hypothetical protein D560_1276 [Bordetella holmesii ATCC 51541]AIT25943.1 hypothetical protein D558_1265 [Bordetella holmesii 44057]EWM43651.1 hypothetical protein D556_1275 [Bordetella holmesii 41130]EWM46513.1 hypothetical protein D555_1288 [Bordetella holmesii 35009]EWM50678.1 hypothetical protein D557_0523 [Bordetella holmesii 70147]EXF89552.1 hypothetical protein D554_0752 [Bordetella holmesii 30539]EXX95760.1 hypothetical protein D559_3198 [Bordetella holmesii 1058]KAK77482.1 hypoth